MRDAFNTELNDIAAENPDTFLLTADIGFKVFDRFRDEHPGHFINMGVAEMNMIGVAAGLAMSGKFPFVYTIIPFLTMRAFEQIRVDVCIQNLNVKIVGVGGGVAYGTLGPTHHSIEDIAILRALPNMTVISPCDPLETRLAVRAATEHQGPVYVRLGKNGEPTLHTEKYPFKIGQACEMRSGSDATIISTGFVTNYALEASALLAQQGIKARVVNMHTIKPIDQGAILRAANETSSIVTVEEHNIIGGLGSAVSEVLAEASTGIPFARLGIRDGFCHGVGSQEFHLRRNGVSPEDIVATTIKLMERNRTGANRK